MGHGPFPLIVFSPGSGRNAVDYAIFVEEIARSGYVIAGLNFNNIIVVERTTEVIDQLISSASSLGRGLVDARQSR